MQTGSFEQSFNHCEIEKLPDSFSVMHTGDGPPGKWVVTTDRDNRVLAQRDGSKSKKRTHLAVVNKKKFRNVKLSARIKVTDGDKERSAGIVWRLKDKQNYLLARIDIKDQRVRLYRVINGNRIRIGGLESTELVPDRWYTLRVEHVDDTIKVYLDKDIVAMQEDRHFRNRGSIGFWTKADSVAYFDDLHVQSLDQSVASQ